MTCLFASIFNVVAVTVGQWTYGRSCLDRYTHWDSIVQKLKDTLNCESNWTTASGQTNPWQECVQSRVVAKLSLGILDCPLVKKWPLIWLGIAIISPLYPTDIRSLLNCKLYVNRLHFVSVHIYYRHNLGRGTAVMWASLARELVDSVLITSLSEITGNKRYNALVTFSLFY